MWRNYFTVGIRALLKSKTYAFINTFGLALALAPCLLILLFVRYETSYDGWIPGADRVFQLQTWISGIPPDGPETGQNSSYVARTGMVKDFPQIESSVHVMKWAPILMQNGEASRPEDFWLVDANLFDVMPMPLLKGDPKRALGRPGDLVLSQEEASRRFPNQDPMGKTLTLLLGNEPANYRVTGILRALPKNTHLRLGMVMRYDLHNLQPDALALNGQGQRFLTDWSATPGRTYFRLRSGKDAETINTQIPRWLKRTFGKDQIWDLGTPVRWSLVLGNIRDIHLDRTWAGGNEGIETRTIMTFGMIALLILGMAVVNFINLATARGAARAREVALRKVAGASRRQLVVQFLAESILLTALAMLIGLAAAELLLPYVNAFLEVDMTVHYFGRDGVLLPILTLILVVGITGGIYPAFYLSRFRPAQILKANRSAAETEGSGRLRTALVVSQFAISIGLIICTAVVYAQIVYARTADQGYRHEKLLQIGNIDPFASPSQRETFRHEVGRIEGVRQVALTNVGVNAGINEPIWEIQMPGKRERLNVVMFSVDANFFETMGMTLLAGRTFDEKIASRDMIMTEQTAKTLGLASPQAAIGKNWKSDAMSAIAGVVKDARLFSIRDPIPPTLYRFDPKGLSATKLMVRYDSAGTDRIAADIGKIWRRIMPSSPVIIEHADDRMRNMYQSDEVRGRLFGAFALVAVLISCLGLFGLAAFTAERRTKEIGIRKVLGATTQDIVRLLTWQFSRPALVANLIAWPVAWWLMRDWLNGFDARIPLSPAFFIGAGALALIIAIATIASHSIRVARAKPVGALRYE